MKILFAASEIYPYAKTGGLADVAQSLPRALSEKADITSIMPLYDFIDREAFGIKELDESFMLILNDRIYTVSLYSAYNQGVKTLFVYEPMLCGKASLYGDKNGDYPDNDIRFGLFSKAVVFVAERYEVDILHLNDWHTALAALWAREILPGLHTVFTIHNLAFQGIFPQKSMRRLGLDSSYFTPEGIEFWGEMNCVKAGIAYSDIVTTVSPRYAGEILQPEFGCGLDGFLRLYQDKLYGILNGIDTHIFDPRKDPSLPQNYSVSSLEDKKLNKERFCKLKGFKHSDYPLFIFIGRFTRQKGLDLIIDVLPEILNEKLNLAVLGEGDREMADRLKAAKKKHKNLSLYFGYKEPLSHLMYAAADFLLMPSSFEPCGLNQLISLRYGTIPVVHRVGGIYDTIRDLNDEESKICGSGIAMDSNDTNGLLDSIRRALTLYSTANIIGETARRNMQCDVSFQKSAQLYLELYSKVLTDS